MNPSRHTGRILRLSGILAGLAAVRAASLARATVTTLLPVLLPLDQGARDAILGGTAARIFGLAQESRLRSAS